MVDNNEHTAAYKSTVHPDFLKTMVTPYARMALHSAGMTKQLLARVMDESLPVMGADFFASLSGKLAVPPAACACTSAQATSPCPPPPAA